MKHRLAKRNYFLNTAMLAMATLLASPNAALSDSGGTASDGCHQQTSTGTRRCHNLDLKSENKIRQRKQSINKAFNRKNYPFKSYKHPRGTHSFYTGSSTCQLNVDHVVALKDIHVSGGGKLSNNEKSRIANDRDNHVPACASINKSKGASTPAHVSRKSADGKGVDYTFIGNQFCAYVVKYHAFKVKYALSFSNNNHLVFKNCGLDIDDKAPKGTL